MGKTANYGLPKWEKSDFIKMEDFNAAFGKIDETLKANADAAASKAEADTVTAIAQTLGSGGQNCRIAWGNYTGSGTYGEANPTTIALDFCPVLAWVVDPAKANSANWPTTFLRGSTLANGVSIHGHTINVIWADDKLQWYDTSNPEYQMNQSGTTYYYVVLGYTA